MMPSKLRNTFMFLLKHLMLCSCSAIAKEWHRYIFRCPLSELCMTLQAGSAPASGPPSLVFDSLSATPSATPLPSLTGVSFAYSTLENALPNILDEVSLDPLLLAFSPRVGWARVACRAEHEVFLFLTCYLLLCTVCLHLRKLTKAKCNPNHVLSLDARTVVWATTEACEGGGRQGDRLQAQWWTSDDIPGAWQGNHLCQTRSLLTLTYPLGTFHNSLLSYGESSLRYPSFSC